MEIKSSNFWCWCRCSDSSTSCPRIFTTAAPESCSQLECLIVA